MLNMTYIKKVANEKLLIEQKSWSFTAIQHSDFAGGEKGWTGIEVISLRQGTNASLKNKQTNNKTIKITQVYRSRFFSPGFPFHMHTHNVRTLPTSDNN